ncbi:hypothetical protein [Mycoplasma feriruminatoris]|uniref:Uncharacterized protein n=1 Tax=Mycoplasma feriruminatoris TaxID=1179777 RepID=A0AAX3TEP3_9MOLU|nr:hypothetical protein [Mycoplasma feriruminatoris]WFQ92569.1 hypothetical protein MFERI14822_00350 [Mycoplasma feriruminatoris]
MKKLLVLLSSSVLLSLSFSSIYLLNYKNNNQVVLKQENKETDLTKLLYNAYVSIITKSGKSIKDLVLEAIKKKYSFLDFSALDIEVGKDKNGRESTYAVVKPKSNSNKYKNSEEIKYYIKKNLSSEPETVTNLGKISVNTETEILKAITQKIDSSSLQEKDFFVTAITEESAIINAKEDNDDYYGNVKVNFQADKKTLDSVFYNFKFELTLKSTETEIIDYLIKQKPKLKGEKLSAQIDLSKNAVVITVDNSSKNYQGSTILQFSSIKPEQLVLPRTPENISKKEEKTQPKIKPEGNQSIPESKPLPDSSKPKTEKETHSEPSPKSEPNKTTPMIDKSQNKNSDNKIPSIPNNTMNKSNKKTTGSKTGVIVGSTLGVGSVVGIGAAGSWIYFKRRK